MSSCPRGPPTSSCVLMNVHELGIGCVSSLPLLPSTHFRAPTPPRHHRASLRCPRHRDRGRIALCLLISAHQQATAHPIDVMCTRCGRGPHLRMVEIRSNFHRSEFLANTARAQMGGRGSTETIHAATYPQPAPPPSASRRCFFPPAERATSRARGGSPGSRTHFRTSPEVGDTVPTPLPLLFLAFAFKPGRRWGRGGGG